ncbi:MAG: transporter [Deltaproteobacteria bacterium]|nr:transporter [Deltaproteobacteria bacterium]MBI4795211.1 transporter [Deltaproteobacteria bacterium]
MISVRIWVFLLSVFCVVYPATGAVNPVTAAEEKEKAVSEPSAIAEGGTQAKEEAKEGECPSTFGPIITDTAIPIEKGKFAVQPTFGLSFVTNTFSLSWRRVSAGGDFQSYGMSLKLTYGLWNNLEVYTVIPYLHNWASNVDAPGPLGERAANFGGLGDISLTFKYRLVEETQAAPTVSALFTPTFPSGHFRHLNPGRLGTDALGGGTYAFTTGFNLSKYVKPFIFYGNLWYTFQTSFSTDAEDEEGNPIERRNHPRDFVTVNLAAEYPLTKKWVALLELTSTWDAGRIVGPKANAAPTALLSLLPGIEYMATDKFSLAMGVNIDLAGKDTNANITPLLSMVYAF